MKTIIYDNGYKGEFDDTLQPGDLITAYQKGYHEFIKFQDRGAGNVPLVHYRQKFNFNGKPCNSKKILVCDAAYCRRAAEHINAAIIQKQVEINMLKGILC